MDGCSIEDRISQLNDHILVCILSLLSIKDAVSTCVLSKRWQYVWTYTYCLNFDATNAFLGLPQKLRKSRYIEWVNQVLSVHKSLNLDEFRVCFGLHNDSGGDIDRWIDFAIKRRVKRLEIDLASSGPDQVGQTRYSFSEESHLYIKSPCGISSIMSLKHLSFTNINVTGELLEHFLFHCPLLDWLSVEASRTLSNLKVSGSSLRLKSLEIFRCISLESVEICAPELVSFVCLGLRKKITFLVKHAPSLVELSIGEMCDHVVHGFLSFSSWFSKLRTLTLWIYTDKKKTTLPQFPQLTCLKSLTFKVYARADQSLLDWTSLLKASPCLERFSLQLLWIVEGQGKRSKASNFPLQCLKVVEIVGFLGFAVDTEFGQFLIDNAIGLEEFTIDCRYTTLRCEPDDEDDEDDEELIKHRVARKHAREFGKKLNSTTKLVIK